MGTQSRIISPVDLRRPQGDLRTTDCREPIIGLIIVVAIVGDANGDALGDDGAAAHNSIRRLMVALCTHQPTTPRTNGVAPSCMADARGRSEGHLPPPIAAATGHGDVLQSLPCE